MMRRTLANRQLDSRAAACYKAGAMDTLLTIPRRVGQRITTPVLR